MPREKLLPKRHLQAPASSSKHVSPSRRNITKTPFKRPVQRPEVIKSSSNKVIKSFGQLESHQVIRSSSYQGAKQSKNLDLWMKTFFVMGFLFLAVYAGLWVNQEVQLSLVTPKIPASQEAKKPAAKPTQIIIPKVNIDLPIEETAITNGIWQIGPNGASHLAISARPGEKGTIIMYGHNTNNRLGPIRWLGKGEKIQLKSADGKIFTYTITKTMQIASDKVDILNQKGETLVLYTCDGFADLKRFVVIAKR